MEGQKSKVRDILCALRDFAVKRSEVKSRWTEAIGILSLRLGDFARKKFEDPLRAVAWGQDC